MPWLGASPADLVSEEGFGLLEIKCPFTHCFATVEAACSDPNYFATITNNQVTVKQYHKHYCQIQGQIYGFIKGTLGRCDYVIYTHQNFTVSGLIKIFWDDIRSYS